MAPHHLLGKSTGIITTLELAHSNHDVGIDLKVLALLPNEWVKMGLNVASLRGKIAGFSGQKICHDLETRKHQRLCDTNRFPAFCPEQQEPCDLKTKLRFT